jgi:hypothetical protein
MRPTAFTDDAGAIATRMATIAIAVETQTDSNEGRL